MKKKLRKYIILPLLAVLWLCGCGKKEETDKAEAVPDTAAETESQTEETEEKEQERTQYPVSEADTETIYADREKNQELASQRNSGGTAVRERRTCAWPSALPASGCHSQTCGLRKSYRAGPAWNRRP